MATLTLFLQMIFACFIGNFLWFIIKESSDTNIRLFNRFHDERYNYLAIIYKDIEAARLSQQSDDAIFQQVKEKFSRRGYRFQYSSSLDNKYLENLAFIENVINDKTLLIGFVATPTFGKKDMRKLEELVNLDEKKKDARAKIQHILIDKSSDSIDLAILWLKRLLTKDMIVVDPDEPQRKPGRSENAFSIYQICLGVYFDENTKKADYYAALSALHKVYPTLFIPESKGHAGDNEKYFEGTFGKRKEKILEIIKETIEANKKS